MSQVTKSWFGRKGLGFLVVPTKFAGDTYDRNDFMERTGCSPYALDWGIALVRVLQVRDGYATVFPYGVGCGAVFTTGEYKPVERTQVVKLDSFLSFDKAVGIFNRNFGALAAGEWEIREYNHEDEITYRAVILDAEHLVRTLYEEMAFENAIVSWNGTRAEVAPKGYYGKRRVIENTLSTWYEPRTR